MPLVHRTSQDKRSLIDTIGRVIEVCLLSSTGKDRAHLANMMRALENFPGMLINDCKIEADRGTFTLTLKVTLADAPPTH